MPSARCLRVPSVRAVALLLAALLGFAAPAGAITVDGLYRAEVEVSGKGGEARAQGFRRALERVLVKVSGTSAVESNPDVQALLESPARFVQEFRYKPIEGAAAEPGSADDSERPTHRLLVQFAQGRIDRALRQRGIVVWDAQRPQLLVWLAVDNGDRRLVVSSDGDSRARQQLLRRARERGLPVMLPLMDMTDRSRVDYVDIQGGFLDAVRSASDRYRPTALLVGHVQPQGDQWVGSWNLLGVGDRDSWRSNASDLVDAVAHGVDGATDRVARAFAGRGEQSRELRLRVTEVGDLAAYARVSEYLSSLVRVRSAEVARLEPREVVFRVTMNGRLADLERAITLGSTLTRVDTGSASTGDAGGTSDGPPGSIDASSGADGAAADEGREAVDLTFRLAG